MVVKIELKVPPPPVNFEGRLGLQGQILLSLSPSPFLSAFLFFFLSLSRLRIYNETNSFPLLRCPSFRMGRPGAHGVQQEEQDSAGHPDGEVRYFHHAGACVFNRALHIMYVHHALYAIKSFYLDTTRKISRPIWLYTTCPCPTPSPI
jgi:hypothetical protein